MKRQLKDFRTGLAPDYLGAPRFFIVGQSGSGKTMCTKLSRTIEGAIGCDLDILGYREDANAQGTWKIPTMAHRLMRSIPESQLVVYAGVDRQFPEHLDLAMSCSTHIICLFPKPDTMVRNLENRKKEEEPFISKRLEEANSSKIEQWKKIAEDCRNRPIEEVYPEHELTAAFWENMSSYTAVFETVEEVWTYICSHPALRSMYRKADRTVDFHLASLPEALREDAYSLLNDKLNHPVVN